MYQAGKSAAIFLKHKAKDIAKKAKKGAKKFYKKNPVFNKTDVSVVKQYPGMSAAAVGVGAVAGEGLYGIGSGTYNLATGKRNVRVKKQTAKEIKKMQKMYNI